jgi:hypothetical protein
VPCDVNKMEPNIQTTSFSPGNKAYCLLLKRLRLYVNRKRDEGVLFQQQKVQTKLL